MPDESLAFTLVNRIVTLPANADDVSSDVIPALATEEDVM